MDKNNIQIGGSGNSQKMTNNNGSSDGLIKKIFIGVAISVAAAIIIWFFGI